MRLGNIYGISPFLPLLCSQCGKEIPEGETHFTNYKLDKAWHMRCNRTNVPEIGALSQADGFGG